MNAGWRERWIVLTLVIVPLWCMEEMDKPAFAVSAKGKKEAKPSAPQIVSPSDRPLITKSPDARAGKPLKNESEKSVVSEPKRRKHSDQPDPKTRQKSTKKLRPKATLQPRPILSYYGKFERPQRYDPSREYRKGGTPNPQAGELLHDHFQELDKNHDGMIDPFERASGRLDIDRDLANRQWE